MSKENKSNPNLVVQSNSFINFKHSLGLQESKLFLSVIAQITREDAEFKKFYTINVKDFMNSIDSKNKGIHSQIASVAESLSSKKFRQINPDGSFLFINYIASAEYKKGTGAIEIEISSKLIPYLLELKSHFTQYDLRNILLLKSTYSIILYQILKQYENLKTRYFLLDDLKDLLDAANYTNFSHFKMRVLDPARKEFAEKCDILFDYEETKENKKVVGVKFKIFSNPLVKNHKSRLELPIIVESKPVPNLLEKLNESCSDLQLKEQINNLFSKNFIDKDIETIINHLEGNAVKIFDALSYVVSNTKIKNKTAYILKSTDLGLGNWETYKQGLVNSKQRKKKANTQLMDRIGAHFRKWKESFYTQAYEQMSEKDRKSQEMALLKLPEYAFIFSEEGELKTFFTNVVAEEFYKNVDSVTNQLFESFKEQVAKEYKIEISFSEKGDLLFPENI